MDFGKIKSFITQYKNKFDEIDKMEIYKWQAIKTFQNNFNIESDDFHKMLEISLGDTDNLMSSTRYYPRKVIIDTALEAPDELRGLFRKLYNQDNDRIERIVDFRKNIKELYKEKIDKDLNDYQDHRAIIVYLSLRYPEDNYFYKFNMLKDFIRKIDYDYIPISGRLSNITQFYSICEIIKDYLVKDNELIRIHQNRLGKDEYIDTNYNVLTQDFIYAVASHLDISKSTNVYNQNLNLKELNHLITDKKIRFKGKQIDYIRKAKRNKHIGDLGELLVIENEKKTVVTKYIKKISHVSKNLGDGLGYDILSFDSNGNEKFIEVKTTTGNCETPFYLTATELEKSKKEQNNYYIYRVYNYDENKNTGDYFIINGELTKYCNNPLQYEVIIKME